jgi:hypothetical protein
VDEYANNRAVSIHENVLQRPKRIRALKFTIMKPTGEPIEMTTDGGFEIEMYSSV